MSSAFDNYRLTYREEAQRFVCCIRQRVRFRRSRDHVRMNPATAFPGNGCPLTENAELERLPREFTELRHPWQAFQDGPAAMQQRQSA